MRSFCSHQAMHDALPALPARTTSQPVPFRLLGSERVLVTDIPVLQCPSCQTLWQDLDLLAVIEEVLERHRRQGDARSLYPFSDLAGEVDALCKAPSYR